MPTSFDPVMLVTGWSSTPRWTETLNHAFASFPPNSGLDREACIIMSMANTYQCSQAEIMEEYNRRYSDKLGQQNIFNASFQNNANYGPTQLPTPPPSPLFTTAPSADTQGPVMMGNYAVDPPAHESPAMMGRCTVNSLAHEGSTMMGIYAVDPPAHNGPAMMGRYTVDPPAHQQPVTMGSYTVDPPMGPTGLSLGPSPSAQTHSAGSYIVEPFQGSGQQELSQDEMDVTLTNEPTISIPEHYYNHDARKIHKKLLHYMQKRTRGLMQAINNFYIAHSRGKQYAQYVMQIGRCFFKWNQDLANDPIPLCKDDAAWLGWDWDKLNHCFITLRDLHSGCDLVQPILAEFEKFGVNLARAMTTEGVCMRRSRSSTSTTSSPPENQNYVPRETNVAQPFVQTFQSSPASASSPRLSTSNFFSAQSRHDALQWLKTEWSNVDNHFQAMLIALQNEQSYTTALQNLLVLFQEANSKLYTACSGINKAEFAWTGWTEDDLKLVKDVVDLIPDGPDQGQALLQLQELCDQAEAAQKRPGPCNMP